MKKKDRIARLEAKVKELENRIKLLEIMKPVDGIEPYIPPYQPYQPLPYWQHIPPPIITRGDSANELRFLSKNK